MKIIDVNSPETSKAFLDVARAVYKDDPNWVCPLDKDINGVFDPALNPYFSHGVAKRWILQNDQSVTVGRIAAFIDHNAVRDSEIPYGGCGFFECINDQSAANLLFDTAKNWLAGQGMQAMNGPVNFGETDQFWGLLVDGFTQPAYKIAYNPKYYQSLFENYGFRVFYRQEGFHLDVKKDIDPRFRKIAEWVHKKPGYEFRHFTFKDMHKYAEDFVQVFNEAWKDFKKDFEPLEVSYVLNFLKNAKMILEEEFIWLAYYNNEPIAIYLMYPDVNQLFKPFNGKLNLWNKLRVLYMVKTKKMTRARGVLMGVTPKFQGLGVESGFILELEKVLRSKPQYSELEFSWVGDFNPPMRRLWLAVGAVSAKHYITYRYMFDPNAPYERYPIIEDKKAGKQKKELS